MRGTKLLSHSAFLASRQATSHSRWSFCSSQKLGLKVTDSLSDSEDNASADLCRMGVDNYTEINWRDWNSNKAALTKAVPFFAREFVKSSRETIQAFDNLAMSGSTEMIGSTNRIFDEILEPHLSRMSIYLFESGGKLNRGTALINSAMHLHYYLQKNDNDNNKESSSSLPCDPSAEKIRRVLALASAAELMQDTFLLVDDIMDEAIIRRGRPCYHRTLPSSNTMTAINDGFILEQIPYWISDTYLGAHNSRFFRQIFGLTTLGQLLDSTSGCIDTFEQCRTEYLNGTLTAKECLDRVRAEYSLDRYLTLGTLKTAHYTVRLPMISALYVNGIMSGNNNNNNDSDMEKVLDFVTALSLKLGIQFQMDDDWIDLFSESGETGKIIGGDLIAMKCSYINCLMFQLCNEEQLTQVIFPHFGRKDSPESISLLKQLCIDIGVLKQYESTKEHNFGLVEKMVEQMHKDPLLSQYLTFEMFSVLISKLKNRKK